MKLAILTFFLLGFCSAFSPVSNSQTLKTIVRASLDDIGGATAPLKNWDPLKLQDVGGEETLRWFRAAELKHSRVAMVATVGYLVNAAGMHFPGNLSKDLSFETLAAMRPIDAWAAVPDAGKAQILFVCLIAEIISESKPVHYMKGGP